MPDVAEPVVLPRPDITEQTEPKDAREPGYLVICWDDPINTMLYVTHVFQKVFGWTRQLAEKRMLEVHNNGKSVLAREDAFAIVMHFEHTFLGKLAGPAENFLKHMRHVQHRVDRVIPTNYEVTRL